MVKEFDVVALVANDGVKNEINSLCIDGIGITFDGRPIVFYAYQEVVVKNVGNGRIKVFIRDLSIADPIPKSKTVPAAKSHAAQP